MQVENIFQRLGHPVTQPSTATAAYSLPLPPPWLPGLPPPP
jgi:hypothetical protein